MSRDGIMLHEGGTIVMASDLLYEMFGYPPGSLIGRSALDLVDMEYVDYVRANYESNMPLQYLAWAKRADGTRFRAEVQARNIAYGDGHVRAAIVRDLSGQDESARERAETISLLRATLDSTADGILVVDSTDKIRLHNERFLDLWRIPAGRVGQTDAETLESVLDQIVDPQAFIARVRTLYRAPETESVDTIELVDGRVIERYSRPQRIGDRIIGRVWSFRDVTSQRRAEQALELAVQMRDEFLGIASHELFTPITSLSVAVRGLRETGAVAQETRDRLFRNAERQVERLARLVQELLDVTRIDGGHMSLTLDELDLADVARDVLERFASELERDKIEVKLEVRSPCRGHWDRTRLEQVVTNLLDNAIKYGKNEGREHRAERVAERHLRRNGPDGAERRPRHGFRQARQHVGGLAKRRRGGGDDRSEQHERDEDQDAGGLAEPAPRREAGRGRRDGAGEHDAERRPRDAAEQREHGDAGHPQPRSEREHRRDHGDGAGNGDDAPDQQAREQLVQRDGVDREVRGIQRLLDGEEQRQDRPAEREHRAGEHHDGAHQVDGREVQREQADHDQAENEQAVQSADDDGDELADAALEAVAQHKQPQPYECCNHSGPSCTRRPPTSSTKRSSRSAPPRTSSTVPHATTCPFVMTATWSHMRCTRSIT